MFYCSLYSLCVCVCVCVYVYVCVCMYVRMYSCMHVYMRVCMYECIYMSHDMTLRTTSHSIQGFSAFEQTTVFRVIEIFMNRQHTKWMFHSVGYCTDRHERRRVTFRERQSVQQSTEANWLARARDSRCAVPSKTRPARPCRSLVTADGAQRERERG
jgi:hypothetical protein